MSDPPIDSSNASPADAVEPVGAIDAPGIAGAGASQTDVDLLLVAAVSTELRPFADRLGVPEPLPDLSRIRREGGTLALLASGMGRSGDGRFAAALADLRPAAVVNVGIAGALHLEHHAGSTYVIDEWRAAKEPFDTVARPDAALSKRIADRLDSARIDWAPAKAVTVDAALHDPAARDRLREASGAQLVEMEGAPWAALARQAGVPFAAVRVVSDHANRPMPGPGQTAGRRDWLLNEDGSARLHRLAWAWVRSGAWLRPRHNYREVKAAGIDFAAALAALDGVAEALMAQATLIDPSP